MLVPSFTMQVVPQRRSLAERQREEEADREHLRAFHARIRELRLNMEAQQQRQQQQQQRHATGAAVQSDRDPAAAHVPRLGRRSVGASAAARALSVAMGGGAVLARRATHHSPQKPHATPVRSVNLPPHRNAKVQAAAVDTEAAAPQAHGGDASGLNRSAAGQGMPDPPADPPEVHASVDITASAAVSGPLTEPHISFDPASYPPLPPQPTTNDEAADYSLALQSVSFAASPAKQPRTNAGTDGHQSSSGSGRDRRGFARSLLSSPVRVWAAPGSDSRLQESAGTEGSTGMLRHSNTMPSEGGSECDSVAAPTLRPATSTSTHAASASLASLHHFACVGGSSGAGGARGGSDSPGGYASLGAPPGSALAAALHTVGPASAPSHVYQGPLHISPHSSAASQGKGTLMYFTGVRRREPLQHSHRNRPQRPQSDPTRPLQPPYPLPPQLPSDAQRSTSGLDGVATAATGGLRRPRANSALPEPVGLEDSSASACSSQNSQAHAMAFAQHQTHRDPHDACSVDGYEYVQSKMGSSAGSGLSAASKRVKKKWRSVLKWLRGALH